MSGAYEVRLWVLVSVLLTFANTVWATEAAAKRSYAVPSMDEVARVDAAGPGLPGAKIRSQYTVCFCNRSAMPCCG